VQNFQSESFDTVVELYELAFKSTRAEHINHLRLEHLCSNIVQIKQQLLKVLTLWLCLRAW